MVVRTATADDAPAALALSRSVVEEGHYTVREPSEFGITEAEERGTPGNLCLVATDGDGAVVGAVRAPAGTYRRTRHFADVGSLWVDASWRRRGMAGGLLLALISWARDHPEVEKPGLFVFSINGVAIRLYGRHGFVVEGRYPRDVKPAEGSYADTVAMGLMVKDRPAAAPD